MSNCFKNCKTLIDLHNTIESQKLSLEELSPAEQERLVAIFLANTGEEVELPLTPRRFNYICAELNTRTLAAQAAEEIFDNMTNFMEDDNMTTKTFKDTVDTATETIKTAAATVKVEAGRDAEDFKDKSDAAITTIKDATFLVLDALDNLTGCSILKDSLTRIIYKNAERGSQRGFFDMASECRRVIYEYIDCIMAFNPDETRLREVAALKYMLGEDEDGKPTGRRSIFTSFANSVVWICRKVTRKFRAWFGVDAEHNVFGSVGAALASVFGMATRVIGSALKVAAHVLVFTGAYVVSAVIKAVSFVWEQLKKLGTYVKTSFKRQDEIEDIFEDAQEEVILEEYED